MENSNYSELLTCVLIHEGFKCYSSCGRYKMEIGRHERVLFLLMRHKRFALCRNSKERRRDGEYIGIKGGPLSHFENYC